MSIACFCLASSFGLLDLEVVVLEGLAEEVDEALGATPAVWERLSAPQKVTIKTRATQCLKVKRTQAFDGAHYLLVSICRLMLAFSRLSNWLSVFVLLFLPSFTA